VPSSPGDPVRLVDLDWPLRTARLSLRPAAPEDAASTWVYRQLPEVTRWLTWAETRFEQYDERFREPARLATTLLVEHGGAVIGDLMLRVEDAWAQGEVAEQARAVQAELGWSLHPAYTGRGLATEAVRELLRIAFDGLGLRRVTALCFADNVGSWRLMERIGMRREAHNVADSLHRTGEWLDGLGYALLAEEWRGDRR
jgi:RimJ/RimL family protein N-acetyltransferase